MTETLLVLLRSSTPNPWKYHDHCLLLLFSIIKSLGTIGVHYLLLTASLSKLPVASYWIKLLFLSVFIPIPKIRGNFLPYFPSKRVLRPNQRDRNEGAHEMSFIKIKEAVAWPVRQSVPFFPCSISFNNSLFCIHRFFSRTFLPLLTIRASCFLSLWLLII